MTARLRPPKRRIFRRPSAPREDTSHSSRALPPPCPPARLPPKAHSSCVIPASAPCFLAPRTLTPFPTPQRFFRLCALRSSYPATTNLRHSPRIATASPRSAPMDASPCFTRQTQSPPSPPAALATCI